MVASVRTVERCRSAGRLHCYPAGRRLASTAPCWASHANGSVVVHLPRRHRLALLDVEATGVHVVVPGVDVLPVDGVLEDDDHARPSILARTDVVDHPVRHRVDGAVQRGSEVDAGVERRSAVDRVGAPPVGRGLPEGPSGQWHHDRRGDGLRGGGRSGLNRWGGGRCGRLHRGTLDGPGGEIRPGLSRARGHHLRSQEWQRLKGVTSRRVRGGGWCYGRYRGRDGVGVRGVVGSVQSQDRGRDRHHPQRHQDHRPGHRHPARDPPLRGRLGAELTAGRVRRAGDLLGGLLVPGRELPGHRGGRLPPLHGPQLSAGHGLDSGLGESRHHTSRAPAPAG